MLPSKVKDRTGQICGRLSVLGFAGVGYDGYATWRCLCDCGNVTIIRGTMLSGNRQQSCGCLQRESIITKHGRSRTRLYRTWGSMIARCRNPNHPNFHQYGANGRTVCRRWFKFENFAQDMGEQPPGKSIDRIDNNKGYFPKNCRWATRKQQQNNRKTNHRIQVDREVKTLTEWSEISGLSRYLIATRMLRGWDARKAITVPSRIKNKRIPNETRRA